MLSISLDQIQTPQIFRAKSISIDFKHSPIKYYRHGWQSWSLSAWTDLSYIPIQKPTIFHPLQVDAGYAYESNPHGSWLGAVQFTDGMVLFLGALATDTHVFLKGTQLEGQSEADDVDWLVMYGSEESVFAEYVRHLSNRFGKAAAHQSAPRVWCSWYSLYTAISEDLLYRIFDELDDLPFDVLQVDDGWQKAIGDWEVNEKFPSGMKALADKIKSTGRRAGLWLAPLIAVRSSRLFQEHPHWFLKKDDGGFVSAGFNWGEDLFALDTTLPEVQNWLTTLVEKVRTWGFDYYKLDFLYGGALHGKRFINMPREMAYRTCLQNMRNVMGADAFFLSCGTPIIPAIGTCDAIRIGPDVSSEWMNTRNEAMLQNFSTPSTQNAIRTVIHRLWLKEVALLDPDVAYFVSKENTLSSEHKHLLQDLALICNFKATSDLPQWMTPEDRAEIKKFLQEQPQIKKTKRYEFQINGRTVQYTNAMALPLPPRGVKGLFAELLGILGNWRFALKLLHKIELKSLNEKIARIQSSR